MNLKYTTIATSSSILLPENSYSTCHYHEDSSDLICLHIDTKYRQMNKNKVLHNNNQTNVIIFPPKQKRRENASLFDNANQ